MIDKENILHISSGKSCIWLVGIKILSSRCWEEVKDLLGLGRYSQEQGNMAYWCATKMVTATRCENFLFLNALDPIWCQKNVASPLKLATLIRFKDGEKKSLWEKAARPFKLISCRIGCRPIELFGKFGGISWEMQLDWWRSKSIRSGHYGFHR